MPFDSVIDAIGHTPLVRLPIHSAAGVQAYGKLELQNLFAMKDRVAKQAIVDARERGILAKGAPIIESSSGTMALGLALVGRHLGHPVHIVTDPRIDSITLAKLTALGCVVHIVEAMTAAGWQSARLERLTRIMQDLEGAFWPRQYHNEQNPLAYRALADELHRDLGDLDVIVGSVGSGGSLCGTAATLLDRLPRLRVVGVDAVGSMLFGQPDRPQRRQSGLGNSLQPGNIDYSLFDEVHWLSDDEAFDAARALAQEQQIFAGNTSGSVYRVLSYLARRAEPGSRLVGIFPDRGDRYVESVFQTRPTSPIRREPVRIPYGTQALTWSYARLGREDRPQLGFIESNTTGTGMVALRVSARLGVEPVFFTADPTRYRGLDQVRCRIVECRTDDQAELAGVVKAELPRAIGVTSTSEFYLPHAAGLAQSLGLPGNPVAAVEACRDKAQTRHVLAAAAIHQPRFAIVRSADEVDSAMARTGRPSVVKPVDDTGSYNVLLCATAVRAREHVDRILAATTNVRGQAVRRMALVEEHLAGPELSVEMFSVDGRATCVGLTAKTTTAGPHFVELRHVFPAPVSDDVRSAVITAAGDALAATGIRDGATHVEVRLTPDGPAIIEINARLAGGMIPQLVHLAVGVDLLEQQLRAACGLPLNLEPTRAKYAGIQFLTADRAGTVHDVTGAEQARRLRNVDEVELYTGPGSPARLPSCAYDRLGHVIAVGATPADVESTLDEAIRLVRIEVTD